MIPVALFPELRPVLPVFPNIIFCYMGQLALIQKLVVGPWEVSLASWLQPGKNLQMGPLGHSQTTVDIAFDQMKNIFLCKL